MEVKGFTINEIIDACRQKPEGNKKLQIPNFQRRRVWDFNKEDELIDTLKSTTISIGALNIWKIGSLNEIDNYLLVDGLHRVTTLTKYYDDPFCFQRTKKLILNIIKDTVDAYQTYKAEDIDTCCKKWFSKEMLGDYSDFIESKGYAEKKDELREIVKTIADKKDKDSMTKFIMDKTKELVKNMDISKSIIPVILNVGTIDDLALLFKRINQNGSPLSLCDVLAAVWINSKIKIQNTEIVECISDHYKDLKHENNNMEIYMIGDEKTYNIYEYMIGLKRYLLKKYENTFLGLIKDKEFIFKLVACCYYEDVTKKSIEKLNTTLIGENLNELEKKLEFAIQFVSNTFDKIVIFDKNLLIKEIPIYIALITLSFNNMHKILKREKYYSDLFVINLLNDKLSDTTFNMKIIKLVVTNKKYMNKIYKAEFIEKMNRFISDGSKFFGKHDLKPTVATKIILQIIQHFNNPEYDSKFGNIIPKKVILGKSDKIDQCVNCIGNVCLYPIFDPDRKPTQTIVNYLETHNFDDNAIETNITFLDGESKFDNILTKSNDFDKNKYKEFTKFRAKKIKEILLNIYKDNMKDDSDDDESDSDSDNNSDNNSDDDSNDDDSDTDDDDSDSDVSEHKSKHSNSSIKNNKIDTDEEDDDDELPKKKKSTKSNNSNNSDSKENSKKIIKNIGNRTSIKIEKK